MHLFERAVVHMPRSVHIRSTTLELNGLVSQPEQMSNLELGTTGADGFYSRGRLLAGGFTDEDIRAARACGTLVRLHRGVYAPGLSSPGPRRPLEVLRIVGVARRAPSTVVSHASAAVLHNIPLWRIDPAVVHLTRDGRGGSSRSPGRVVHSAALRAEEIVNLAGVVVTSVARTLVDLARTSDFEPAVIACDISWSPLPNCPRPWPVPVTGQETQPPAEP